MQLFLIKHFYHFDFMKIQIVSFYQQKKLSQGSIKWQHNAHSNQISQKPKFSRGTKWLMSQTTKGHKDACQVSWFQECIMKLKKYFKFFFHFQILLIRRSAILKFTRKIPQNFSMFKLCTARATHQMRPNQTKIINISVPENTWHRHLYHTLYVLSLTLCNQWLFFFFFFF